MMRGTKTKMSTASESLFAKAIDSLYGALIDEKTAALSCCAEDRCARRGQGRSGGVSVKVLAPARVRRASSPRSGYGKIQLMRDPSHVGERDGVPFVAEFVARPFVKMVGL